MKDDTNLLLAAIIVPIMIAACTAKLVSSAPPLPQKVTQCEWDIAQSYFKGDAACEQFLRDYVASRVGH